MKVTPDPISNSVVKLHNGENTWWEAAWEDSKSRVHLKNSRLKACYFIFCLWQYYAQHMFYYIIKITNPDISSIVIVLIQEAQYEKNV